MIWVETVGSLGGPTQKEDQLTHNQPHGQYCTPWQVQHLFQFEPLLIGFYPEGPTTKMLTTHPNKQLCFPRSFLNFTPSTTFDWVGPEFQDFKNIKKLLYTHCILYFEAHPKLGPTGYTLFKSQICRLNFLFWWFWIQLSILEVQVETFWGLDLCRAHRLRPNQKLLLELKLTFTLCWQSSWWHFSGWVCMGLPELKVVYGREQIKEPLFNNKILKYVIFLRTQLNFQSLSQTLYDFASYLFLNMREHKSDVQNLTVGKLSRACRILW